MIKLLQYLEDHFLKKLYTEIKGANPIKSISVDLTNNCNLRCTGCYYYAEGMDLIDPGDDLGFDYFINREKKRGTNFITVVGGEPSLYPNRLKKIYSNFKMNVATNGIKKIPLEGLENMPIGVSVWGNTDTDSSLRSNGTRDLFTRALYNYKNDDRAFWYYTVAPGLAHEIQEVVERCIDNGNRILFNYYSDISGEGGVLDYHTGFGKVTDEINRMISLYPDKILNTSYLNGTVTSGELHSEKWGYNVCTNVSENCDVNRERIVNGHPYNKHFRAYNADFNTTRRCCTGIDRSCDSCYDTWEHFSWIMINMRKHLGSKEHFTNWLTTTYMFYMINKIIEVDDSSNILYEIHSRSSIYQLMSL